MKISKVKVCDDCRMPIGDGDFTALDFHYTPENSDQRYQEICKGMDRLVANGGYLTLGDDPPEELDYFSTFTCECCGTSKNVVKTYTALVIKDKE